MKVSLSAGVVVLRINDEGPLMAEVVPLAQCFFKRFLQKFMPFSVVPLWPHVLDADPWLSFVFLEMTLDSAKTRLAKTQVFLGPEKSLGSLNPPGSLLSLAIPECVYVLACFDKQLT